MSIASGPVVQVAWVTDDIAGTGSLGEATARALRGMGFRVLTSTRTCARTADTHPLELTSRESVSAFASWVEESTPRLDGHLTPYDSWAAYGTSKLALVHEAAEIERRYGARGLHGYSVHPGSVHTRIADRGLESSPLLGRLRKLAAPLERRALATPDDGSRTTVFCATSDSAVPGGYHRAGASATPSADAQDSEAARLLWDATDRWVGEGRP